MSDLVTKMPNLHPEGYCPLKPLTFFYQNIGTLNAPQGFRKQKVLEQLVLNKQGVDMLLATEVSSGPTKRQHYFLLTLGIQHIWVRQPGRYGLLMMFPQEWDVTLKTYKGAIGSPLSRMNGRAALFAVNTGQYQFDVLLVHLNRNLQSNNHDLEVMADIIKKSKTPIFIAGDFNRKMLDGSKDRPRFVEKMKELKAIPGVTWMNDVDISTTNAASEPRAIDHLLFKKVDANPLRLSHHQCDVLQGDSPINANHYPMLMTITLENGVVRRNITTNGRVNHEPNEPKG